MTDRTEPPDEKSARDLALARLLDGEPEPGDGDVLAAAMAADPTFAAHVKGLLAVDDLLRQAHDPDPAGFADAVQTRIVADEGVEAFVRGVAEQIRSGTNPVTATAAWDRGWARDVWRPIAVAVLLALGVWGYVRPVAAPPDVTPPSVPASGITDPHEVAWLVNAQDCRWAAGGGPGGGLVAGKAIELRSGLAELSFSCGATAVLQGPARLEIVSGQTVRLTSGKLSAKVSERARGFTVLSPEGRVVDLGTEFGMEVRENGATLVHVYRGEVTADRGGQSVSVREAQTATIGTSGVTLAPKPEEKRFVREIVSPPVIVPRTVSLDFRGPVEGTIRDWSGMGTGFTHRLPGTGSKLPALDPNLRLVPSAGRLELTATRSDLRGQMLLDQGEYLGARLADLGFTGAEDFEVEAVFADVPALDTLDQFGLYAGSRSDRTIRGGLLRPAGKSGLGDANYYIVHGNGHSDSNLSVVGVAKSWNKVAMTLKRSAGQYSLKIEDLNTLHAMELSTVHPKFLDNAADLYVGLYAATPTKKAERVIPVEMFRAKVFTRQ